ncbi:GlcG/HbpS family heme-binding protein [Pandoraea anhela]|uniref:Cobalamin adenosyltransferase n=1 Tax=Pandoraea anhela TaxID=2508295 RepID=A0A5E4WKR5_9BURK|nr:heme-binding protein [Pandoraea anhela]VVE23605.1 cobalamin adenosyltransferase [Pandoraea anhela]
MYQIKLETALRIIDAALEKSNQLGLAPLCAAVLDAGGRLIAVKRQDGASFFRPDIAIGKAFGCLAMGFGGAEMARRAQIAPQFFNSLTVLSEGKMVPVPGGVLIRNHDGMVLGAIGISGDTSLKDEECAIAGIAAVDLKADCGNAE